MDKNKIILKAENISKQYRLGTVGTGTLSHDLNRFWCRIIGKEDPYLKVGEVNDRSAKGSSEYVWALKDINFEVEAGEVLGIIGKNGAGKSTLLKILSKVTAPTTGSIKSRGRIASLLEVGTGFNPELTGRENIYLNGAILGMTKKEITSKINEIIEFSGCERYIDTPTKRYSSGMTVRLAFAVAAFLEPEILVVDEVLAVGDAEFQKKAIGKMQDISREGGRTVLFVSHNMAAVKSLCTRGIVLENGCVSFEGISEEAIDFYLENQRTASEDLKYRNDREGNQFLKFNTITIENSKGKKVDQVFVGEEIKIRLQFERKVDFDLSKLILSIIIYDLQENIMCSFPSDEMGCKFDNIINNEIVLKIPFFGLRANSYTISLYSYLETTRKENAIDIINNAYDFEVITEDFYNSGKPLRSYNCAFLKANFE
ncbi:MULTISPECIES: ABC transporter ATP-binding protein [Flavobacterium]|uniref:ABC transporter ATP-binding protein n=1 Tax=Flavobacterium jumunjinense TaxID=998845 RepID=A0ABV5GJ47_9FLAO|nr:MULTISPECIES: ABC transporter ATP-binding protein [Flavobacterium]